MPPEESPVNVREYASVPGYGPLLLDLYLPVTGSAWPVILFIHGGAWMFGDRTTAGFGDAFFPELTAAGFAVASVDYRLSGDAPFPAQLDDVKAAVRWLREHGSEHGYDGTRVVAWGESAGGHLAALLGLTQPDAVAGVIDWYGPADLTTMQAQSPADAPVEHDSPDSPEGRLIGGRVAELHDAATAASPIAYVRPDAPPFQIRHGAADRIVPCDQSRQLAAALQEAGVSVDAEWIPEADHVWQGAADPRSILDDALLFARKVTGLA
jgi:acetyl esterase/lipase